MQQLSFDLTRAEQQQLLDNARLSGNGTVSGRMLKAVLFKIDDFARLNGECFASQETLAQAIGCRPETIKRAIAVLVRKSLITCELRRNRFGLVTNHCRIVWSELALLCTQSPVTAEPPVAPYRSSTTPTPMSVRPPVVAEPPDAQYRSSQPSTEVEPIGQSIRAKGQFVRPMGQSIRPMGQSAPQTVLTQTPPPTRTDNLVAEECLDPLEELLQRHGVRLFRRAAKEARKTGLSLSDVQSICDEYTRHKTRFDSDGAILWRIREGCWPVDLPTNPTTLRPKRSDALRGEMDRDTLIKRKREELKQRYGVDVLSESLQDELDEYIKRLS